MLERPVPRVFRGVPTIAVSESTARDLERRGLSGEDITVIPNGIDVRAYTPLPPGEERFDEPTLLFVGRVKRYKRPDLIVEALRALRERGIDARLLVAGRGDHTDALARHVRQEGVEDHVDLLGFIPEERKRELLCRSWVHVLTSPKEGWGISNLEAAASGTPSVASDSPGLRESVLDGETGFLAPHGDVDALADRLEALLTDAELRERMGRRARAFAEGFSWDASAGRVLDVLRNAALRNAVLRDGDPADR